MSVATRRTVPFAPRRDLPARPAPWRTRLEPSLPLLLIGTSAAALAGYAAALGSRAGAAHLLLWPYLAALSSISFVGGLAIYLLGGGSPDLAAGEHVGEGLIVVPVREWERLQARAPMRPVPRAPPAPAPRVGAASWDESVPGPEPPPLPPPAPASVVRASARTPARPASPPVPPTPTVMAFAPGITGMGGESLPARSSRGDRGAPREVPTPTPLPVEPPAREPAPELVPAPAPTPAPAREAARAAPASVDPSFSTRAAAEELEATLRSYGISVAPGPAPRTPPPGPTAHGPGGRCPGCRQLLGEGDPKLCDSCGLPMCSSCDRATSAAGHPGLCQICMALLREAG